MLCHTTVFEKFTEILLFLCCFFFLLLLLGFRSFFRIQKIEEEIGFCLMYVPYAAFAVYFAHTTDDFLDFRFHYKYVSRKDGGAETDFIHTGEQGDESPVFFRILESDSADLGHGFTDEGARHDGMSREMALEERFIHGHAFDAYRIFQRNHVNDFIDQQHGVSMRQDFHDFFNIEFHSISSLFQSLELFGKPGVQFVTAKDGDDMGMKGAHQGNISQDIENLVAYQFIRETGN